MMGCLGSSDRSIVSFDTSPHGESESEERSRGIEPPRRCRRNSGPMHYKCIASTTEPYGQRNRVAVELLPYQSWQWDSFFGVGQLAGNCKGRPADWESIPNKGKIDRSRSPATSNAPVQTTAALAVVLRMCAGMI